MNDDFPILAAVAAYPAHPYQLLDHLNTLGVRATRSTLYRRVDSLVEAGLLDAREERGERGHPRRSLHLTETGRTRVARETADVLRREPLESPIFALALDCAQSTNTEMLPDVLKGRMALASRKLTEEERALAQEDMTAEYWSRAGRERRVAHLRADVAWLQSVLARRGSMSGTIQESPIRQQRAG